MTHQEGATVVLGDAVADWCRCCLKTALNRASIYAVAPSGLCRIGVWAVCEECGYSPYADTEEDQ